MGELQEKNLSPEELKKILDSLPSDAFDGHTDFSTLTTEERLMWLSQIAQLVASKKTAV